MQTKAKKTTAYICRAAAVAAFYVILTELSALLGISSGIIQFRLSEMLCVLPAFMPAAIPGLAIGCFLSNLLTGCVIWDIIFGTVATLIGALGAYFLRKYRYLVPIPTIIANVVIIPFVLRWAYYAPGSIPFFMMTVGIGEIVCCGILGGGLEFYLLRYGKRLFE